MTREEAIADIRDNIKPVVGGKSLDMAIKALEQEPCTDAISMDKTIVQLSHLLSDWDDDWNVAIRKCIETVKIVPPVTAEKVGQWIKEDEDDSFWLCSECGQPQWELCDMHYCPNCGAKMQASPTGAESEG